MLNSQEHGTLHYLPSAGAAAVCGGARAAAFIRGVGAGAGPHAAVPPLEGTDWSVADGHGGGVSPGLRQSQAPPKGLEARSADVCGLSFVRTRTKRCGLRRLVWEQTEKPRCGPRPATFVNEWRPPTKGGSQSWLRLPSPPLPHAYVLLIAKGSAGSPPGENLLLAKQTAIALF